MVGVRVIVGVRDLVGVGVIQYAEALAMVMAADVVPFKTSTRRVPANPLIVTS